MFGISSSVRSRAVQVCTPELFHQVTKSGKVKDICAQIEDALERMRRGELSKEDYNTLKTQLKSRLPILTPHATFKNGRRLNSDAIPSGLSIYDKDHIPDPRGYWEEKRKVLAEKGMTAKTQLAEKGMTAKTQLAEPSDDVRKTVLDTICLVHVTPSTEGLRLIFKIPEGMGLAEAQKWMSEQLEDQDYDTCVKDLARPSFLVPEDYILYIDEKKLFGNEEESEQRRGKESEERRVKNEESNGIASHLVASEKQAQSEGNAQAQVQSNVQAKVESNAQAKVQSNPETQVQAHSQAQSEAHIPVLNQGGLHRTINQGEGFDAPPTSERSGSERRAGAVSPSPLRGEGRGERWSPPYEGGTGWLEKEASKESFPSHYSGIPYASLTHKLVELLGGEPQHGSRNSFIFTLACYMRYLCDDNVDWIKSIIPTFGEEQKRAFTTVESACARKQSHSLPAIVRRAVTLCQQEMQKKDPADDYDSDNFGDIHNPESYFYRIHEMPEKLPKLIRLLVSKTPEMYQAAVSQAVFPPLAAHLCDTRFRYIDNVEHEATLMSILCAPTGSGKECISEPINRIMADIRRRDAEQRDRERAWKDECNSKGANKDKRERPEGLVIQEVNIDMTNPAFVLRMKEAEQHFLYAKVNELNLFDALKGKTNQHFRIMELAFDLGNYGQDRVGVQSVTETVRVRFNWNACCTPKKCREYFSRVVTDGPVSRISFSTIERRPCGSPIPVYGTYDAAFDEELRPYIDNLVKARGLVNCPQALKLAKTLVEENAEFARLSQNYVFENLSFRANVIAYLKACVLYVANGMQWEKSIEDFVRWSERYDLWCKLKLFGQMIYKADNEQENLGKTAPSGPKNLLRLLPDEFTANDYINVRRQQGFEDCNLKRAMGTIRQWVHRGYAVAIEMPTKGEKEEENQVCDSDSYSSIFRKLKFRNS